MGKSYNFESVTSVIGEDWLSNRLRRSSAKVMQAPSLQAKIPPIALMWKTQAFGLSLRKLKECALYFNHCRRQRETL
jgi:hypothetical protein